MKHAESRFRNNGVLLQSAGVEQKMTINRDMIW